MDENSFVERATLVFVALTIFTSVARSDSESAGKMKALYVILAALSISSSVDAQGTKIFPECKKTSL